MRWQIYIDRGGTFTDALGIDPESGAVRVAKVLSSDRAPIEAVRALIGLTESQAIPPCDVRMGTTLATTALLERKGVPTALAITEGFGDLLRIGDQTRPDLFAIDIERAAPLYARVCELAARGAPDGSVLTAPDDATLQAALRELHAAGIESVAVSTLHAHRNGALEVRIGAAARAAGIAHVSLSHEVVAEIGLLARTETTVVDAYVTPLVRRYAAQLAAELPGSDVRLMQSSGTLCAAGALRGRDAVLSGPAGGAVAVARIADALKLGQVIGFDMGGTSTDVMRYAGELERVYETRVRSGGGTVRVRAPAVDIHTVAAGGGSVCRIDQGRMTVGPDSAGADPGPLCYGRAGEAGLLALTDVNLALGRIVPDRFPLPLDSSAVWRALSTLRAQLGSELDEPRIAAGFFEIAIEHMADAIRRVSIARGHDVRDHALVAFGGASGQHACALARRLGMRKVVLHPYAGVLSAWGMGGAAESRHSERDAAAAPLEALDRDPLRGELAALEQEHSAAWRARGQDTAQLTFTRRADLRYRGTETALTLEVASGAELRARFEQRHLAAFGYTRSGHPIEIAALRVESTLAAPAAPPKPGREPRPRGATTAPRTACLWLSDRWIVVPVLDRDALIAGQAIDGPAIVLEAIGTIIVDPGFRLSIDSEGIITLEDRGIEVATRLRAAEPLATAMAALPDPVQLEVMGNRFMSIAEQMGVVLGRTALSTNIRERLDYSCALFDARGGLVSNAPHIPVHLGAMSETVRAVLALHDPHGMRSGDAFCANDPALGGSHLPDITLVSPVFDAAGVLAFFTASRGHHADVGGSTPGSMPPFSTTLDEEGSVFRGERIAERGAFDEALVRSVLSREPYPARDPDQNIADLRAQIAANRKGEQLLRELCAERGQDHVAAYMQHVQRDAELRVRRAIAELPAGEHRFEDTMDDGTRIAARIVVHPEPRGDAPALTIDFSGSSGEVESNLNAPRAVTVAAVIYVLRVLTAAPIPLNSGCLAPVELFIPERSVLHPSPGRAVAAGNVETSQRIVDVLLGGLGKLAACQGTMNNLTFGSDAFGYYETIAGGAGASARHAGQSGVHTHMTNTRITDPEILEARFPVQLLRFALRHGSGGAGRLPGGEGVVRELRALTALHASILSDRRRSVPFGLAGGGAGAPGRNLVNGVEVAGRASLALQPGDVLRIETPGGGGWGWS
jgi:5-oxoprolinase (ATP-hydrolysing)